MTADLIDAMRSLTALMVEESDQLVRTARVRHHEEIADAKVRLVGRIEAAIAKLKREQDDWLGTLDEEAHAEFVEASQALRDASAANAEILSRQIEISVEMMAAIASEAQRLSGKRNEIYGATGGMTGMAMPAPISINTRL